MERSTHACAVECAPLEATSQWLMLGYDELRNYARRLLGRDAPGQTLQATALVHEAYLRLQGGGDWQGKRHFFGAASLAMRRVLVDRARSHGRIKRGGGWRRVDLGDGPSSASMSDAELLDLDFALDRLGDRDARMSEVVHLRFFMGLTVDEVATVMGLAPRSVDRAWLAARTWLMREVGSQEGCTE